MGNINCCKCKDDGEVMGNVNFSNNNIMNGHQWDMIQISKDDLKEKEGWIIKNGKNKGNGVVKVKVDDKVIDGVFYLLNDIRTHPLCYIRDAKEYGAECLLKKASERSKPPPLMCKDGGYYNEVKNVLVKDYKCKKNEEEIENDIKNREMFKSYKVSVYIQCVSVDKPFDSVWKLFENKNAYENILINIVDYCVVCALRLKEDNEMKIVFVLLESKL